MKYRHPLQITTKFCSAQKTQQSNVKAAFDNQNVNAST